MAGGLRRGKRAEVGQVPETPGNAVIAAGVSESRMRKLACEKKRWPVTNASSPGSGLRIRSTGLAPMVMSGKSRRLAPVRPLRMLPL